MGPHRGGPAQIGPGPGPGPPWRRRRKGPMGRGLEEEEFGGRTPCLVGQVDHRESMDENRRKNIIRWSSVKFRLDDAVVLLRRRPLK